MLVLLFSGPYTCTTPFPSYSLPFYSLLLPSTAFYFLLQPSTSFYRSLIDELRSPDPVGGYYLELLWWYIFDDDATAASRW